MADRSDGPMRVKRSYREGHVSVGVKLKARGWQGESITVEGGTDLTTDQAKALAAALIEAAHQEEDKIAKKAAHTERRAKWREKEIAAGRMNVMKGLS